MLLLCGLAAALEYEEGRAHFRSDAWLLDATGRHWHTLEPSGDAPRGRALHVRCLVSTPRIVAYSAALRCASLLRIARSSHDRDPRSQLPLRAVTRRYMELTRSRPPLADRSAAATFRCWRRPRRPIRWLDVPQRQHGAPSRRAPHLPERRPYPHVQRWLEGGGARLPLVSAATAWAPTVATRRRRGSANGSR